MKGVVRQINPSRGMVAAQTDGENFSVFESLGGDFELGDEVSWNGDSPLGGEEVINHTQQVRISVFFEGHHLPFSHLRRALLID